MDTWQDMYLGKRPKMSQGNCGLVQDVLFCTMGPLQMLHVALLVRTFHALGIREDDRAKFTLDYFLRFWDFNFC